MAAFQIIALDTATPQLRAPASGDTYSAPRAMDITPETLTGSAATSSLSIAQTWNTTGTPTAIDLNVTDTASNAASLLFRARVGGTNQATIGKNGVFGSRTFTFGEDPNQSATFFASAAGQPVFGVRASARLYIQAATNIEWGGTSVSAGDLVLARDAANTLAQRNGVNAQAFRVYNTFTDASNYERLSVSGSVTSFRIAAEAAGTGASRSIVLDTAVGSGGITFATGGTSRWAVSSSAGGGHLIASADNTYDIGASGANRPRDVYIGGTYRAGTATFASNGFTFGDYFGSFGWSGGGALHLDGGVADTYAFRRGTNAQTFRIYNTYTDASNYERGVMAWSGNILQIGTQAAGTGTSRVTQIVSGTSLYSFQNNDIAIFPAAGGVEFTGRFRFSSPALGIVRLTEHNGANAGALELPEWAAAPAAPAANNVRIYAEDNGAGKTRLMARFATGAAQQIAIEP